MKQRTNVQIERTTLRRLNIFKHTGDFRTLGDVVEKALDLLEMELKTKEKRENK